MEPRKMMGLETEADRRVQIPVIHWNAMKLALWRSRVSWVAAAREAARLVDLCAHTDGCPGKGVETEPCLSDCPDRETRMSALVILNAARQFAPVDARRPANAPYFAPSRERFSEVIAELSAAQAELEVLRKIRVDAQASPPPNLESALPELPREPMTRLLPQGDDDDESPEGDDGEDNEDSTETVEETA